MRNYAVVVGVILLIGLGLWFGPRFMIRARFAGFPGHYKCENFGIPDKEYANFRISEDLNIYAAKPGGFETHIGQLKLSERSQTRARLELSMDVVHAPTLQLDPFAQHVAEGVGGSLVFSASRENNMLYSEPCSRVDSAAEKSDSTLPAGP